MGAPFAHDRAMNRAEREAVEREVRRLVDSSPFELFELRIGQDRSLHVYLDRRDGRLSVGDAARFNHEIRRELAAAGMNVDAWSIEVESPGAFRPLRNPRHFEKSRGQRIRIVRRDPAANPRVVSGTLRDSDEQACRLEPDGGGPQLEIRFDDVAEARLDPKLPF
jgi:ribosome maturation factor RimP